MSLESSFERLGIELAKLEDTVSALHVTVVEDKPTHGEAALVDALENAVTELVGISAGTLAYARKAAQTSREGSSLMEIRGALHRTHELINRFCRLFLRDLAGHDVLERLIQFGRERDREWQAWIRVVKTVIERCAGPLDHAQEAILECWQELSERLASKSVSVQATNIGQNITLREDAFEVAGKVT